MCGIAGFYNYKEQAPPLQEKELLRMRDVMVKRGPDGAGLWIDPDGITGLAHRRLSIIDLSAAGAQPMATEDGRLRIVFNGEIYNYRELRAGLEKKGYRFQSNSDTEVLLHLYYDKGQEMVRQLRGMFAFALWDGAKKGLFLARDPFGIKPLYYSDDGFTLRFASQVKALLAGGVNHNPDPAGHVGFFLWGSVPEPYTLYKGIRALPAGAAFWANKKGRQKLSYCNLSEELAGTGENNLHVSAAGARERLRSALADSVKYHLVADVDVGVFLSSGIDSGALTALASKAGKGSLRTITLGFAEYRGTENDESLLAELVAQRYGTAHQTYWISAADFQSDVDHFFAAMDQPTINGLNTYFVSKVAAGSGLKVALSGVGGDELFGGYSGFRQIPRMVKTFAPARFLPGLGKTFRLVSAPWLKRFTSPKYAGLLEYGSSYGGAYLLRRGLFMPWELPNILDGDMVREGWRELQPLVRLEATIHGIKEKHLKVSALEFTMYMRNQLLRDTDWAGMAHSLEIRVPLVDLELFRSITPLLVLREPPTKLDMALSPYPPLPDEVINRRKTGFSVPMSFWLQQANAVDNRQYGLRDWALNVYEGYRNGGVST